MRLSDARTVQAGQESATGDLLQSTVVAMRRKEYNTTGERSASVKSRMVLVMAAVFLVLPMLSWAGSFYANITLIGTDPASVTEALQDMGLTAVVVLGKENAAVVCEKTMDSQDDVYGRNLTRKLSKSLECVAVYVLNHDSDELLVTTYAYGEKEFDYDSSPGYFTGVDKPPAIHGMEKIDDLFPGADSTKLRAALESEYVSADDRHVEIGNLLSLPYNVPGLGYRHLMDKKFRSDLERQFGLKFVEVDQAPAS
jgi:hypothetical protein